MCENTSVEVFCFKITGIKGVDRPCMNALIDSIIPHRQTASGKHDYVTMNLLWIYCKFLGWVTLQKDLHHLLLPHCSTQQLLTKR